jgi:hypothetical protein
MSLFALALSIVLCSPSQGGGVDPVEAEFRVRDFAMGALVQSTESWDWTQRYRGLEALLRREPGVISQREIEFVRASVSDDHSNVRASSIAACAHHDLVVELPIERLAADSMPGVRIQLARTLGRLQPEGAAVHLARLALDPDEDVARVARAELFSQPESAAETQFAFLREHWGSLDPLSFLHILDVIDRSNGMFQLIEDVSEWQRKVDRAVASPVRTRRALWFTVKGAQRDEKVVRWLAQEWTDPFPPSPSFRTSSRVESWRRRRMEGVELTEPYRAQLVNALMEFAAKGGRGTESGDSDAAEAYDRASRAITGAVAVHFAWRGGEPAPPFPIQFNWNAELEEEAWSACFGWADSWGDAAGRMLDSESEDVRSAAWNTLAETSSRTGEALEREWLSRAMSDGFLAESVYRELVHSKGELADLDLLHGWWSKQSPDVRLDLLRDHWPGREYGPWRRDLLDFWVLQTDQQRVVLELLAGFAGDEALEERFLNGVQEELQYLERNPVPAKDVTRGLWRDSESRARWQLEAWMKIQGPGHTVQRTRLLLRVAPLGKELGKALVANLAATPEGCAALEEAFTRPELSRRARYEILLLHPGMQDARRVEELYLAYPTCDEDLQLRILERAAKDENALARALLVDVAADEEEGPTLRFQAVASLMALGSSGSDVVADLLQLLDGTEDFEFQQSLIRAIAALATDHKPSRFLERYDDDFERSMVGDELISAMVQIELRACASQGTAPALSSEILSRWRALPGESAKEELLARFDGTRLAARNFAYSGWLEAAKAMHAAGLLESSLGPRWWSWDGRLLMRLAEVASEEPTPEDGTFVRRLEQAAFIAVTGEGPSSDRVGILLRLRGRLLASDLRAKSWKAALARTSSILADWRASRVPDSAVERAFGPTDAILGVDPRTALLAIELECWIRLALEEGNEALVAELRPHMHTLGTGPSRMARRRLRALHQELGD